MTNLSYGTFVLVIAVLLRRAVTTEDIDFIDDTENNDNSSNKVIIENCTNDLCVSDEEYIDLIRDFLAPDIYDWILISLHIIVFIGGLVGNSLVCIAVYRNRSMRTVTNYFIVNLAIADLLVIIFCLPPTVLWDVTETWFLGDELCKIIPYLQVRFMKKKKISFFIIHMLFNYFVDLIDKCQKKIFRVEFSSRLQQQVAAIIQYHSRIYNDA